jgi:Clostripain family
MATPAPRPSRHWLTRGLHLLVALALLAGMLSSCADDPQAETPTATRRPSTRPTRTPAPSKPTATPARPSSTTAAADWTILVYLDGDNDLEDSAIDDYSEMATVGSSKAINIIVQFDRISSDEDWDNTSYGDWRGVKRFRVEKGKRPVKGNQIADLGERNMGDPKTVVDFVSWGIRTYPAKHYALIFWDHGASWPGIASDDTSDGDMLTLPEIADALAQVRKQTGVQKLDLIGFDACLMGQIDVLQAVAPYGQVAIGSADLEPGEGWAWNAWLSDLAKKPQTDAAALAPSIIKSFTAFYKEQDDPSVTLSAFDLNDIDQIAKQLDTLSRLMIKTMPGSYKAIAKARAHAAEYASGDTDISAVDLGNFADSLASTSTDPQLVAAARALSKSIKTARIIQGNGADHTKSSGITVYFPKKQKHYDADYRKGSPLTKTSQWDEFLQVFYTGGRTAARPAATKAQLNQPAEIPDRHTLEATIAGDDTAYVYSVVGVASPSDPSAVQILALDYIYPPGVAIDGVAPTWHDGDPVQLDWKSTVWYLSNGDDAVIAPIMPIEYGSSTYSVDGTYTSASTGTQTAVSIEFEVLQGQGTLQHIWAFDTSSGGATRPRELTPRTGDSFSPDILAYAEQQDDLEAQAAPGQPLVFGASPLALFESAAPAGDYLLGLLVENSAGDISDQYAELSITGPDGDTQPAIPAVVSPPADASSAPTLFHDEELGFAIEAPAGWEPSAPGVDKIVFTNPDAADAGELAVDVYALEGRVGEANSAMVEALLEEGGQQPGFALRQAASPVRLDSHNGLRVEYVYLQSDGTLTHVIGIAVSDSASRTTYLVTYAVPEVSFSSRSALFEKMLASFTID